VSCFARCEALNAKRGGSPIVLNNLAWLYFEMDDPRAEEVARSAYKVAPLNRQIADKLGWILLQRKNAEDVLKYMESAAGARPEAPSINYHVAVAYEKLNRRTEARRSLDRSLKSAVFPERADADALKQRL
jgi:predicted Zn-dependent protease